MVSVIVLVAVSGTFDTVVAVTSTVPAGTDVAFVVSDSEGFEGWICSTDAGIVVVFCDNIPCGGGTDITVNGSILSALTVPLLVADGIIVPLV
jgi:hypothetical protein